MRNYVSGTVNYQIITDSAIFWENDFFKAKIIFDKYKKRKEIVKIILEQWEGEIGGDGVHSEDIIYT